MVSNELVNTNFHTIADETYRTYCLEWIATRLGETKDDCERGILLAYQLRIRQARTPSISYLMFEEHAMRCIYKSVEKSRRTEKAWKEMWAEWGYMLGLDWSNK